MKVYGGYGAGIRHNDTVDGAPKTHDEQLPGLVLAEGRDGQAGIEQDGRLASAPAEDLPGAVIGVDIGAHQRGNGAPTVDIPAGDRAAPARVVVGGDRQRQALAVAAGRRLESTDCPP